MHRRSRPGAPGALARPSIALLAPILIATGLLAPPESTAQLPTSLSITPATVTLTQGDRQQYLALAELPSGETQDVTAQVEWRTTETDIARFSREEGKVGLLEARGPGTVTVRAILEIRGDDLLATASVEVKAGVVVGIATKPTTKRLDVGLPVQFEAKAVYENGFQTDISERVTWSSSKPKVARVIKEGDEKGRVIPRSVGTAIIRARDPVTGFTNQDGLTEVVLPVTSMSFDTPLHVLGREMTTFLRVYGFRDDGTRTNLSDEAEYVAAPPGIVEVTSRGPNAGRVKAVGRGIAIIQAREPVRGLATAADAPAVVVVAGKLKELRIDPTPIRIGPGESRRPKVFGVLTSGLTTNDLRTSVEWSVADPRIAELVSSGSEIGRVDGVAIGTTTLRAREPKSGVESRAVDNLIVRGRVTHVSVDPATVVLGRGLPYALRAYANREDGSRSNITTSAEWAVAPDGVVSLEEGLLTALADGTAKVTARDPRTGLTGTANVRVAGEVRSLSVLPDPFSLELGETRKPRAIARLSSGLDTSDLRSVVDWSVADPTVARVGHGEEPEEGEEPVLERGEVLGLRLGQTTLGAREPLTGIASTQTGNLAVEEEDGGPGGPGPGPTPRRTPRPPSATPTPTLLSLVLKSGTLGDVVVGQTVVFKARANILNGDPDKNVSDKCQYSIDDPSVATVDNELPQKGGVTGLRFGESTIVRAECFGLRAEAPVQVIGNTISVVIDPPELEGRVGDRGALKAIAFYEGGAQRDVTKSVLWASSDPDVVFVDNGDANDAEGEIRLLAPGEALLSATANSGHFGTSLIRVLPETPPQ